ncbi:MAG: YbaB/EbfC family nucleoid-associated protein [Sporichthyaceae bacterium]
MTTGMPDMGSLLAQAQQMQAQLASAQAELANTVVTGSAGGGLVRASVSGAGELVALEISPEAVDPEDTETLADLVLAAVRDANRAMAAAQEQAMGSMVGGLGELAAGLGLGGAMGALPGGGAPGLTAGQ